MPESDALHKHAELIPMHNQGPPLTTVFGSPSSASRRAVWPGSGRGLMVVGGVPARREEKRKEHI